MAKRGRKPRSDSYAGHDAMTDSVMKVTGYMVPPPMGVELDTPEKQVLWTQWTSYRRPELWLDRDLLLVRDIVVLSESINAILATATSPFGCTTENRAGTRIVNAELQALNIMMNQRSQLIRLLGMNTRASDVAAQPDGQAVISAKRRAIAGQIDEDDDDALLFGTVN